MVLKSKTSQILILSLCLLSLAFLPGAICRRPAVNMKDVNLTVWGLWDDSDAFRDIISDYSERNKNITVNYYKKEYQEYEDMLLNSMAEGNGPDVFLIDNNWVQKYIKKIVPMPQENPPVNEIANPSGALAAADLRNSFVDAVYYDAVWDSKVYALPLSVDTLAMYYNRDMLNNAGIPRVPADWTEFKEAAAKIKKLDEKGNITRAGAAIGTADNISRSADILMLLMMQSGAKMTNPDYSSAAFAEKAEQGGESFSPGEMALKFYTNFSNPAYDIYTWNAKMKNSIDAFAERECAFIFGYSYMADEIRKKQPYLDFDIAEVPQIKESNSEINYANYWMFAVSRFSKHPYAAWDFIKFMTSKNEAQKYLLATGNPTARKDLYTYQASDPDLSVFASQILTAKSWLQKDPAQVDKIFSEMINDVIFGRRSAEEAVKYAQDRVTQTMR